MVRDSLGGRGMDFYAAYASFVMLVREDAARRASSLVAFAVLALVLFGEPARTRADVGDLVLLGDQANLMGGAVVATTRGGSAMWYNPAGVSLPKFDRTSVQLNGMGFAFRSYSAPGLVPEATSTGAQNVVVLPRQVTFVLSPKPRFRFGFGFFNPVRQDVNFQLAATYGYADGAASDSLAQKIDRTNMQLIVSFAYEVSPALQIGMSLQFVADRYFDMFALGSAFVDPSREHARPNLPVRLAARDRRHGHRAHVRRHVGADELAQGRRVGDDPLDALPPVGEQADDEHRDLELAELGADDDATVPTDRPLVRFAPTRVSSASVERSRTPERRSRSMETSSCRRKRWRTALESRVLRERLHGGLYEVVPSSGSARASSRCEGARSALRTQSVPHRSTASEGPPA